MGGSARKIKRAVQEQTVSVQGAHRGASQLPPVRVRRAKHFGDRNNTRQYSQFSSLNGTDELFAMGVFCPEPGVPKANSLPGSCNPATLAFEAARTLLQENCRDGYALNGVALP